MDQPQEQLAPAAGKLSPQRLELLVRQLEQLPTLPAVAARLLALSSRGDRDRGEAMAQIAELATCDPALTARLLHLAQAAGHPARTAAGAVRELGFEAARSAALSVRVYEPAGEADAPEIDLAEFWRHCIAVAAATEMLAQKLHLPIEPGEAFACGLLHDMGKLALLQLLPKSYARVLAAVALHKGNIADYERNILGVEHSVAARRLAEHWRLDETIQQVLWMHHQPIEAIPASLPHRRLAAVVSLADTLARQQQLGFSGNYTFPRTAAEQATQLQLPQADLDDVAERLGRRVQHCSDLLGLDHADGEALYRDALAGANAELGALNERLRRRAKQLDWQAEAFRQLRDFSDSLTDRSTVADVLRQAARIVSAGQAADGAVVAYSIDAERGEILALRCQAGQQARWRTLPCREDFDPLAPQADETCDDAMGRMVGDSEELAAWIDPASCLHQPLRCAGRWVGGVLCPAGSDEHREVLAAMAGAMAMALAIVQGRCNAVAMSEQLAGASQVLAETQDALAEAKTLTAVGEMAAGAAHEMNTPLAVISGRAQLMREQATDEPQRKTWQLIAEQTQRISDILSDLMEFASPPPPQPQAFDVADVLEDAKTVAAGMEQLQAAPVRVDIELAGQLPQVWADRDQIVSAVIELIANAANASPSGSPVTLTARTDDGTVLISIADRGCGMDERTLSQAFTPFFSSQKAGRRRGLGLPRVKRHVEINGGRLWIQTQVGQGTTVYVRLPAANES